MRGVDARFIIIDFISNTQIVLASRQGSMRFDVDVQYEMNQHWSI